MPLLRPRRQVCMMPMEWGAHGGDARCTDAQAGTCWVSRGTVRRISHVRVEHTRGARPSFEGTSWPQIQTTRRGQRPEGSENTAVLARPLVRQWACGQRSVRASGAGTLAAALRSPDPDPAYARGGGRGCLDALIEPRSPLASSLFVLHCCSHRHGHRAPRAIGRTAAGRSLPSTPTWQIEDCHRVGPSR